MADRAVVSRRYMERFACLGGACEDTCCANWTITIDEPHFHVLAERLAAPADRALFEAAVVVREPDKRSEVYYAELKMRDGTCQLLADDRYCTIHRRFGQEALPEICAMFPRRLSDLGGRLELVGTFACPEVVRQALLRDDGLEVVEVAIASLPRTALVEKLRSASAAFVDRVRQALRRLLARDEYPLASRLYFAGYLAEAIGPNLADELSSMAMLVSEVAAATTDEVLVQLHADRLERPGGGKGPALLLAQIAGLRKVARPAFQADLDRILDGFTAGGALGFDAEQQPVPLEGFDACYRARLAVLPTASAALLDAWLTRFARDYCARVVDADRANFPAYVRGLAARLATVRLLAISHPGIALDGAPFAAWFVRVVCELARLYDHREGLWDTVRGAVDEVLPDLDALGGLLTYL